LAADKYGLTPISIYLRLFAMSAGSLLSERNNESLEAIGNRI